MKHTIKAKVILVGGEAEIDIATKTGRFAYVYEETTYARISDDGEDITISDAESCRHPKLVTALVREAAEVAWNDDRIS